MTTTSLSVRQARFVAEYAICGNGAEAARRAGYSERTARQIAHENLTKPDIQSAIAAQRQALAADWEIRKADVVSAVFEAVSMARQQHNPAVTIRGWVEIAKLLGLDRPDAEPATRDSDGEAERHRAHYRTMSTEALLRMASCG